MPKKLTSCKRVFVPILTLAICLLLGCGLSVTAHAKTNSPAYRILVNRAANCVTVYGKDAAGNHTVPVKAMACSCGIRPGSTPLGTFKTSNYYNWRLMVDGTYGQYAVRFYKSILFHSVPYLSASPDSLAAAEYNKLGTAASHGCVRLTAADAKWIFDNCEKGTEVVVYDDAANPGPLGKPATLQLPVNHPYSRWDPTDITKPKNPWLGLANQPLITLTRDMGDGVIYVPVGASEADLKAALGLSNSAGVPYKAGTYKMKVTGTYDLNTFGAYRVVVTATDPSGHSISQERFLAVVYM